MVRKIIAVAGTCHSIIFKRTDTSIIVAERVKVKDSSKSSNYRRVVLIKLAVRSKILTLFACSQNHGDTQSVAQTFQLPISPLT